MNLIVKIFTMRFIRQKMMRFTAKESHDDEIH
jgi:hypothetical protein